MRFGSVLIAGVLLSGMTTSAFAQICAGTPSFANGMAQVAGNVSFTDGAKAYGGQLSVGRANGFFVGGGVDRVEYNDISEAGTNFNGTVGYGISLGSRSQICPVVAYSYMIYPDIYFSEDTVIHTHENNAGIGIGIGTSISVASMIDIIPFLSAGYEHSSISAHVPGIVAAHSSEDYGMLGGGFGIAFSKLFTVQPNLSVPIGLNGGQVSYGVQVSVNFGPTGH